MAASFLLVREIEGMAMPLPEEGDIEGEERWMAGRHLPSAWTMNLRCLRDSSEEAK